MEETEDAVCCGAEDLPDGAGFGLVIGLGGGAVGVDVINLIRRNTRIFEAIGAWPTTGPQPWD